MAIRRLVGVVLAAALGLIPVAPPEHVHELEEHGHSHALVHRHLAPHHFLHEFEAHVGVLDDDDAPVLTLDAVFTLPLSAPGITHQPASVVVFLDPPATSLVHGASEYAERPIHGPPRAPTGLRAPPSSLPL